MSNRIRRELAGLSQPHAKLNRRGLSSLTLALAVYCCVSGGPYGLEPAIQELGSGFGLLMIALAPLVWAIPDALTSCELAPAIPEEGGYIIWVRRGLGEFWSFINGWWTWLYAMVDAAIYPVLFVGYLAQLLRTQFGITLLDSNEWARWAVCVSIVAVFTFLNVRGTRLVGLLSVAFTAILVTPFLAMAIIGGLRLIQEPRPIVHEFLPAGQTLTGALAGGLATVMWNYLGWDSLSTVAEEVDNPQKAYPRAMLFGVPFVAAIYLLPTMVGLAFFPDHTQWGEDSWPQIAAAVGGPWLGLTINLVALVSPIALFTASLLASSRIPFVLAERGYLPRGLVDVHPVYQTPWRAILLCGVVYAILTWSTFQSLVQVNVILYSAALILESLSLIALRIREPNLHRPFRIPGGYPALIVIVALPVCLVGLLIFSTIQELLAAETPAERAEYLVPMIGTALALASGPILYMAIRWARSRTGPPKSSAGLRP